MKYPHLNYKHLLTFKPSNKEKGRKLKISEFWFKHNDEKECFDISWHLRWGDGEKYLIMQVFKNGRVWFDPYFSNKEKRVCQPEVKVLRAATGYTMLTEQNQYGRGLWYHNKGWHDSKEIPTKDRVLSYGAVVFENGKILEAAPAQKREVNANLKNKIDTLIKKVRNDAIIRAKLGAVSRVPSGADEDPNHYYNSRYFEAGRVNAMLKNVDPTNIKSFEPLIHSACALYGTKYVRGGVGSTHVQNEVPTHECVLKYLNRARTVLLRETGAIRYA